jgi:hypothetical protein
MLPIAEEYAENISIGINRSWRKDVRSVLDAAAIVGIAYSHLDPTEFNKRLPELAGVSRTTLVKLVRIHKKRHRFENRLDVCPAQ